MYVLNRRRARRCWLVFVGSVSSQLLLFFLRQQDTGDAGRQGESANQSLQAQLAQERSYGDESLSRHSYFDSTTGQGGVGSGSAGDVTSKSIPTIPEGSAVRASDVPKCPSPQTSASSSAPTTGTTTTPTSIDNVSSGDVHGKGPVPEFPTESLSSSQPSVGGEATWGGVASVYAQQPQQPGFVPYQDPTYTLHHVPLHHQHQHQQQPRYNPAQYPSALKMLVSNNVAGSIIGRSGQTISELQNQSATRIKLSQTGDYYPGTQDRVCLVQGEPENVKVALQLLLERLYALQEHQHSQHLSFQLQKHQGTPAPSFDFIVRLLVPSSSCGMIIGKSGSNIKYMEETTGVSSVRLSPKESCDAVFAPAVPATNERVVTITGHTLECCLQCLYIIIDGMAVNPETSRYTNMTTTYSRMVPDSYVAATGSRPVLVSLPSPRHSSPDIHLWDSVHAISSYSSELNPRRIASSPDLANTVHVPGTANLPDPQTPERLGGYSTGLNAGAFSSPLVMPGTPTTAPLGRPPPAYYGETNIAPAHGTGGDPNQDSSSNIFQHSMSAPDLLSFQLEQSLHVSTPPHLRQSTTIPLNQHAPSSPTAPPGLSMEYSEAFVPQAPTMTGPNCFNAQVLVPDSMIGSILGRGGRALTELQMLSGTRIRISQRGEYMPGTRSRVVTIRGPTAHTVWQAQYMMSQRMILPPTAAGGVPTVPTTTSSPYPTPPRPSSYKNHHPPTPPSPQHHVHTATATAASSSQTSPHTTSSPPASAGVANAVTPPRQPPKGTAEASTASDSHPSANAPPTT